MPNLKEYNTKLTRLRSTRKLTRTMKLVSANKLRRTQEAEKRVAAFTARVQDVLHNIPLSQGAEPHPLLLPRRHTSRVLLLIITSDRGLCGGFNNALLRETAGWISRQQARGCAITLSCCGRKAHAFLRNRFAVDRYYDQIVARPDYSATRQISHELVAGFMSGRLDEVHVAANRTGNRGVAAPVIEMLIPLSAAEFKPREDNMPARDYVIDPDPDTLLASMLPTLVALRLYQILLSSANGEHGARMRAMEQAGSNADALIRALTLQRNRVRQAQITTELNEIVAGAEALR